MEKKFNLQLDDLMNENGVKGIICTDLYGLPLAVKGIAQSSHAGIVSSIADRASKLYPNSSEVPVICIETENSNLLIRNEAKVVLGIYKTKN